MNTTAITTIKTLSKDHTIRKEIVEFYDEASMDYSHWSKDLNMHFGYFIWGKTNPFRRDSMLNEMNKQVYNRLKLQNKTQKIADLGCGLGGTMRYFLKRNPKLFIFGLTLSPYQVEFGNKLLEDLNGIIFEENYEDTSLPDKSLDGVIAVESFCHTGHSKEALREAYRLLKPGSKLVIADAFIKKNSEKLCQGSNYCYHELCKGWSLNGIGNIREVEANLKEIGFRKVLVEDVSMRVAPSVLHVPFAIISFIGKNLFRKKELGKQSLRNLKASFFALLAGLHRRAFGYYLISSTR